MDASPGRQQPESQAASLGQSDRLRRLRASLGSAWRGNRLLLYAALIGVFGGLGAQLFVWMLDWGERIFLTGIAGYVPPRVGVLNPTPHFGVWGLWLIPIATTVGGLLCGLIVYSLAPEAEGHGTDAAVAAYHFHGGRTRPIVAPVKAIASAITIGSGGAAGREGPTAQISVGAASVLCDLLRLPDAERRILVLAGMAAGLSAIFRSPLGMAIFAVEILYGGLAIEFEALPFTLIAAVFAYAVNGLFVGWTPLFALPSALSFTQPIELLGFAILGVAAGIVGAVEPTIFYGARDAFRRLRVPNHLKPAMGGLLMGLLALAVPQTLATGYGWVQMAIAGGLVGHGLLVFSLAKILAMSLTISSGGSGGVFGPNVYIGAMLGGWVAYVMDLWFPASYFVPAAFVVVGMGAVFAATARVPLSTLIMVAEMTGGYGLIVPAMLASSLSFLTQRALTVRARYPRLYEAQVESRLDSPVHQLRLVQGAFRILGSPAGRGLQGISLPDLDALLRFGIPIRIHGGRGYVFAVTLESPGDPLIGLQPGEAIGEKQGLVLVAVIRGEEMLPPGNGGLLEPGDTLIIAASEEGYRRFVETRGEAPGVGEAE